MGSNLESVTAELLARVGESEFEPSLDRISAALHLLGDPQRSAPVVHITGTNGKTSTARMIEALLRRMGLRTGLFTSPHLVSITERIQLDGEPIAPQRFVDLYEETKPLLELVDERNGELSFFETITALAFAAFADAPVDVMIVEVGLGGTWDATNVADAAVAVITPIDIDHTNYLGTTLTQIAGEKAGIIKAGSLAVVAQQAPPAEEILLARGVQVGAKVTREGYEFGVISRSVAVGGQSLTVQGMRAAYPDLFLPLFGAHQAANAALALAAVEALTSADTGLDDEVVREAFATVISPGRLEVLRRSPSVVIDAAHNPSGAAALAQALTDSFSFSATVAVVAVLGDKDAAGILAALEPVVDAVICTTNGSPRAMSAADLAAAAEEVFEDGRVTLAENLTDALDAAYAWADAAGEPGVGIVATGSVITAGAVRSLLRGEA